MTIGDAGDKGVVAYKVSVQRLTANADATRYTRFDAEVIYEQVVNSLHLPSLLSVINKMPLPELPPLCLYNPETKETQVIPKQQGRYIFMEDNPQLAGIYPDMAAKDKPPTTNGG